MNVKISNFENSIWRTDLPRNVIAFRCKSVRNVVKWRNASCYTLYCSGGFLYRLEPSGWYTCYNDHPLRKYPNKNSAVIHYVQSQIESTGLDFKPLNSYDTYLYIVSSVTTIAYTGCLSSPIYCSSPLSNSWRLRYVAINSFACSRYVSAWNSLPEMLSDVIR